MRVPRPATTRLRARDCGPRGVGARALAVAGAGLLVVLVGCTDLPGGGEDEPAPTIGADVTSLAEDVLEAGVVEFERVDAVEALGSEDELTTTTVGLVDRLAGRAEATTTLQASTPAMLDLAGVAAAEVAVQTLARVATVDGARSTFVTLSGTDDVAAWEGRWFRLDPAQPTIGPELVIPDPDAFIAVVCSAALSSSDGAEAPDGSQVVDLPPSAALALLPGQLQADLLAAGFGASDLTAQARGTVDVVGDDLEVEVAVTDVVREAAELLDRPQLAASTETADHVVRVRLRAAPSTNAEIEVPDGDAVVTVPPTG